MSFMEVVNTLIGFCPMEVLLTFILDKSDLGIEA